MGLRTSKDREEVPREVDIVEMEHWPGARLETVFNSMRVRRPADLLGGLGWLVGGSLHAQWK